MCMNLNVCYVTVYVYGILLHSDTVVSTTPPHSASRQTQSFHFKDSTPLFCQRSGLSQTRVESNKISRTARGQRGVFWELNNARKEEKVDIAVCLAGQDP